MNPVFIFFNIYKNTGLVMNWVLRNQFESAFSTFESNGADKTLLGADLERFILENKNIRAISSIGLTPPLKSGVVQQLITGLFLRNPLERIFGIYEADRRQFGISPQDMRFQSIRNYIESKVGEESNSFRDAQVNFIGDGGTYYEAPGLECFNRAKFEIGQINFCGLMHLFDESLVVLEYELGKYFKNIDLAYFPKGVTIGEYISLESRLDLMRQEIGSDLFDYLLNNNRYDLELIQIAEVSLIKKLHSIPNWRDKLLNLQH